MLWQLVAPFTTNEHATPAVERATVGLGDAEFGFGVADLLCSGLDVPTAEVVGWRAAATTTATAAKTATADTTATIRFHHAIVYPNWSRLELYRPERAARLWADSRATFTAQVLGPTFEDMCRAWAADFASAQSLGGEPSGIGQGVLNDPAGRSQLELDIVVRNAHSDVIAIGETKSGEIIGGRHLARLRSAVGLLRSRQRIDAASSPVLLLFSGAGFTRELEAEAASSGGTIQLVGLDRLYFGS